MQCGKNQHITNIYIYLSKIPTKIQSNSYRKFLSQYIETFSDLMRAFFDIYESSNAIQCTFLITPSSRL